LKPWLDRGLSAFSKRWDERTSRKREERKKLVRYLRDHPEEQLHMLAEEMRCRLRAILYLVTAAPMVVIPSIVATGLGGTIIFWFSLLPVFLFMTEHRDAMRCRSLVSE